MSTKLQALLKNPALWQASRPLNGGLGLLNKSARTQSPLGSSSLNQGINTGFAELNQYLPDKGWPQSGLAELLLDQQGIGECRLLLPALAQVSQNRPVLWLNPPYVPYAPALAQAGIKLENTLVLKTESLKDQLWCLEKALASKSCGAILAWFTQVQGKNLNSQQLKRLQVASKSGECLGFVYRPSRFAAEASPAELRIQLQSRLSATEASELNLKILKRRGGWATDFFPLTLRDDLHAISPNYAELSPKRYPAYQQLTASYQTDISTDVSRYLPPTNETAPEPSFDWGHNKSQQLQ